jgi:hypothetical protein
MTVRSCAAPTTNLELDFDYSEGDGSCRSKDRALLKDRHELERVLVVVLDGDTV